MDICRECRLYEIDRYDPAPELCSECLAKIKETWKKLDQAYFDSQY